VWAAFAPNDETELCVAVCHLQHSSQHGEAGEIRQMPGIFK
jgi:hypothetical protein